MGKYIYIQKDIIGLYQIDEPLVPETVFHEDGRIQGGNFIGATYDDYLSGAFVPLKKRQMEFYRANPSASWKEVIEMQLAPLPPEPTLSELKDAAIKRIGGAADSKPEELFPHYEITLNALAKKDEIAAIAYQIDYNVMMEAVIDAFNEATEAITEATEKIEIDNAEKIFNDKINAL